jgi:hypothetical protein
MVEMIARLYKVEKEQRLSDAEERHRAYAFTGLLRRPCFRADVKPIFRGSDRWAAGW